MKATLLFLILIASSCLADDLQWRSLGPDGGFIKQILIEPTRENTIFAVPLEGGVFRSFDAGAHWKRVTQGLAMNSLPLLRLDSAHPSILYAAATYPPASTSAVFKTTNGGALWFPASQGLRVTNFVYDIAVHRRRTEILYVITDRGLFRSGDGARHWHLVNSAVRNGMLAIDPDNPFVLYHVRKSYSKPYLYKSFSGGRSWIRLRAYPLAATRAISIDPDNRNIIYAGLAGRGPYKSTDGGSSWTFINGNTIRDAPTDFAVAGQVVYALVEHFSAGRLFKSVNGGAGWVAVTRFNAASMAVNRSNPDIVYAGNSSRGIATSVDGGRTWQSRNQGLAATSVDSILLHPLNDAVVYLNCGFFRSTDGGNTWKRHPSEVCLQGFDPTRPQIRYGSDRSSRLVKTTDSGRAWFLINKGLGASEAGIVNVAIDPSSPNTLYSADETGNIFKSTDGGSNWSISFQDGDGIEATAIDPTGSTVYIAEGNLLSDPPESGYPAHITASFDHGSSWKQIFSCRSHRSDIFSIAIDPSNPKTVYAGTEEGLYITRDSGRSWISSPFFAGAVIRAVVVMDSPSPSTVYAGTEKGIFQSSDRGVSWRPANNGLSDANVLALAGGRFHIGLLYAGASGGGVYVSRMRP